MKKILTLAFAAAALLTACQKNEVAGGLGGDQKVTLTVDLPEVATKAGDGTSVDELYYELFDYSDAADFNLGTKLASGKTTVITSTSGTPATFEIEFTLIRNAKYKVLYWAQNSGSPYGTSDNKDLRNINMNYATEEANAAEGNDETRDAFFGVQVFTADGVNPAAVTLTRPFAQLNFIAEDFGTGVEYSESAIGEILLNKSMIEIQTAGSVFDVAAGMATDASPVHIYFGTTDTVDATDVYLLDGVAGKYVISMNYVLLPQSATSANVTARFWYSIKNGVVTTSYDTPQKYILNNLAMAANYRTNVSGALFLADGTYDVALAPAFTTPDKELVDPTPSI